MSIFTDPEADYEVPLEPKDEEIISFLRSMVTALGWFQEDLSEGVIVLECQEIEHPSE